MEISAWVSLATICLMGAMTPGPSLAVVLKHTVAGGRSHGLMTSVAHGLGTGLYATLTVVGLAIVIKETPLLFDAIKTISVFFLLYLAYKALTAKASKPDSEQQRETVTLKQSFWEGLMITFLNPKLAIFFLALFSQFIHSEAGAEQNIIMVGTVASIDMLWYCLITIVLSQSVMLSKLRQNSHLIEKVTGVALLILAARVVF
jgi:threonine/homoserine/homoserine lactone efflux protein